MSRDDYRHLYHSAAWQALRLQHLEAHPLCAMHKAQGKLVGAQVVDHIKPHRGNEPLFFDPANLQALCRPCHDRHKHRQEASGYLAGASVDGTPLDPSHPWNEGRPLLNRSASRSLARPGAALGQRPPRGGS